ncbi:MAG TPA: class I tRNA ligase family protein [Verrucomicrobiota bacterium]|nr:class I tRNA ligase family protein [Verrucomicrobiota bacterium]HNU51289.1 class I tRNA ligase family protein [Verrucomicrobiota bacterium]
MSKRFYITTAIDYVNGLPHLGHAYEKVVADVIARIHRSLGEEVFFLTGLDEHGQKVQQAALSEGATPQAYCDRLADVWQTFVARLNLSNSDFVRTTQPRHQKVVHAILAKLHAQGDFYKSPYRGWYSPRQESFLTDKDRRPDGTFDPIYGEVQELVEENWYFRMSRHQAWLIEHIQNHPDFVQPDYRRNEVLGFLRSEPLEDLCISRPLTRLNWGIPLPFDPAFVTYVWFDALSNYYSIPVALGDADATAPLQGFYTEPHPAGPSLWPADVHLIGKDIVKFHAVYWPIMLKAAGIPLPHQILVHGWWQKDGEKMAKSVGNVVDPIAVIDAWGVDPFRYYVLRELDVGPDGNWTDAGFQGRYQAELANGLGNLVNRSLSMLQRYRNGIVPAASDALAEDITQGVASVTADLRRHRLQAALVGIWSLVSRANQYVDQTAPFKLAKDPAQAPRLDAVLYSLAETCRILAVLLWPFLPETAGRIGAQLGIQDPPDRLTAAAWGRLTPGHHIGTPSPLFPRRD